jgi:hypothetical protein
MKWAWGDNLPQTRSIRLEGMSKNDTRPTLVCRRSVKNLLVGIGYLALDQQLVDLESGWGMF